MPNQQSKLLGAEA
jgi:hypothetical protein